MMLVVLGVAAVAAGGGWLWHTRTQAKLARKRDAQRRRWERRAEEWHEATRQAKAQAGASAD